MISKHMESCLQFAAFVDELRCTVRHDAAELCRLARTVFRAGESLCSYPDPGDWVERKRSKALHSMDAVARRYGLHVRLPGLWPELINNASGDVLRIPCV